MYVLQSMAVLSPDEYIRSTRVRVEGDGVGGVDQERSVLCVSEACGGGVLIEIVRGPLSCGGPAGD